MAQENLYTRTQKYLVGKGKELTPEIKQLMEGGNIKFYDDPYFIRKTIAGGGIINILESSDYQQDGKTNIQQQYLPNNTQMAVDRIELGIAELQTGTTLLDLVYKAYNDTIADAAIANAEIELTLDDKTVFRAPVNKFVDGVENVASSRNNGVNLNAPILISDKNKIGLLFHTPQGKTLATNAGDLNGVEVTLRGASLRSKF